MLLVIVYTCIGSERWWPQCYRPDVGRPRSRPTDLRFWCKCLLRRDHLRLQAAHQTYRCPCPLSKFGRTSRYPTPTCSGRLSERWLCLPVIRCSARPDGQRTRTWRATRDRPTWARGPVYGNRTSSVWSGPRIFVAPENQNTLRRQWKNTVD